MFQEIFKNSKPVNEGDFEYFNVIKDFDVSVNFIKSGAKIPPHTHDQEVFNYVFDGDFTVAIDDEEKTYSVGDWIKIPANKLHSVEAKTSVTLLELWRK